MTSLLAKEQLDFAAQMCSRLCHDLISPVGAISNGLEILADEDDAEMRAQVIELLHQSAQVTSAKLRFFRLAFGAPGGLDGAVDVRELKSTVVDFIAAGKADLDWAVDAATLPKSDVKILMICILTGAEALVRGGTLSVRAPTPGSLEVSAAGSRVILDEDVQLMLQGTVTPEHQVSRYAPLLLLLSLLNTTGLALAVSQSDTQLTLTVQPQ